MKILPSSKSKTKLKLGDYSSDFLTRFCVKPTDVIAEAEYEESQDPSKLKNENCGENLLTNKSPPTAFNSTSKKAKNGPIS